MLTMFDTTTPSQVPMNPQAVAGYVTGFVDFSDLVARFPHAHHLSITIDASADADVLDVESGAAHPGDVAAWVARQKARGAKKPYVYASISNMPAVLASINRDEVFVWSAHYTFSAHICAPGTCGADGTGVTADATQYTDTFAGLNVDASLCHDAFFPTAKPKPPPRPDDPHHYLWYPSGAKNALGERGGPFYFNGRRVDERATVKEYDRLRDLPVPQIVLHRPRLRVLRKDLGLLAGRVNEILHGEGVNGHVPWNDSRHLGFREGELTKRAEGQHRA